MFAAPSAPSATVSQGAASAALAGLAKAARAAERARDVALAQESSVQPNPVDFYSLDLQGWKRHAMLTMFRGKDGGVRFTDGRAFATRRSTEKGGVDITLYENWQGPPTCVRAEQLISDSDGVLPGVLMIGPRKGAYVPSLRAYGVAAFISPHADHPLTAAVELRVAGGQPKVVPLDEALTILGIRWLPLDGGETEEATQLAITCDEAGDETTFDATRMLRGEGDDEDAAWRRAGALCTMGVLPSLDVTHVPASTIAQFVAALAGGGETADAVAAA
eukprot:4118067-Pleurochrysis_carterae.AAC.1